MTTGENPTCQTPQAFLAEAVTAVCKGSEVLSRPTAGGLNGLPGTSPFAFFLLSLPFSPIPHILVPVPTRFGLVASRAGVGTARLLHHLLAGLSGQGRGARWSAPPGSRAGAHAIR